MTGVFRAALLRKTPGVVAADVAQVTSVSTAIVSTALPEARE